MGTKFGPKKGEDTATNTILRKLAILVPTYYVFFYIVTCIITAAFGVPIDGKEPFDFVNFNPADGGRSSGKFTGRFLLAMVPFVCCVPLFLLFQKKLIVPLFKCFFSTAVWISYFLMLFVNAAVVYFIGRSTKVAFDYACTLGFIHFILSMLVMLSFPVNWIYWVTAVVVNVAAAGGAELSCYYLRDMRSIKVDHE